MHNLRRIPYISPGADYPRIRDKRRLNDLDRRGHMMSLLAHAVIHALTVIFRALSQSDNSSSCTALGSLFSPINRSGLTFGPRVHDWR